MRGTPSFSLLLSLRRLAFAMDDPLKGHDAVPAGLRLATSSENCLPFVDFEPRIGVAVPAIFRRWCLVAAAARPGLSLNRPAPAKAARGPLSSPTGARPASSRRCEGAGATIVRVPGSSSSPPPGQDAGAPTPTPGGGGPLHCSPAPPSRTGTSTGALVADVRSCARNVRQGRSPPVLAALTRSYVRMGRIEYYSKYSLRFSTSREGVPVESRMRTASASAGWAFPLGAEPPGFRMYLPPPAPRALGRRGRAAARGMRSARIQPIKAGGGTDDRGRSGTRKNAFEFRQQQPRRWRRGV
jgi:hypothetical protein